MSPDAILAAGEQARTLLNTPIFMDAIGGFMTLHLDALMATADGDAEGREKHFRQFRAYENVAADLKDRVAAADQIIAEREQPQTTDDEDY